MMSKKIVKILNDQMNAEFASAYLYLGMSTVLDEQDFKGMAHWMRAQAREEMEHAFKFMHFIQERGDCAVFEAMEKPETKFANPLEVFKKVYAHEQTVTSLIYKCYEAAEKEKDYASMNFLNWFVTEQVEEEADSFEIVKKLEFIGGSNQGLYMLDKELGARQ